MSHGTASNTQFGQVVYYFTTAIATIINEFKVVDLINCLSKKGEKLTQCLRLVIQALLEGKEIIIDYSKKIINHAHLEIFQPTKFLGEGWKVVEQDERLLGVNEFDLNDVQFSTGLKGIETAIKGEERLNRLTKDKCIRLGVNLFFHLWNNQELNPESWKEKINGNVKFITFDGATLQGPDGRRYVLCLYWLGGQCFRDCRWLDDAFDSYYLSALLASKK